MAPGRVTFLVPLPGSLAMLPEDSSRLAFWTIGATLGAVVAYVVYRFVGTFVFGLFIYYVTRPVYRRVRRRVGPPSLAAAGSLFLLTLPGVLLGIYAAAIGFKELNQFLGGQEVGPMATYLEPYVDVSQVVREPAQLLGGDGVGIAQQFLAEASTVAGALFTLAIHLFLMFAIAFYLLRDDHKLARWFRIRFSDGRGVVEEYVRAVDQDLHSIFFGNILNAVITGTIGAITYSILDMFAPVGMAVPYAALLGLLTGAASLIPVVGMKLVYVPVSAYLFAVPVLDGLEGVFWFPVTFAVVSLVVVDTIPDLVLRPYVSGRNLHVGMVMVTYILGPLMFGWYGLFLAPLLLVLVVHFGRIVLPELLSGQAIKPYAVDPSYLTDDAVPTGEDGE